MTDDIIMITNYNDSKIMFIYFLTFYLCFLFIFHYHMWKSEDNIWE